MYRVDFRGKKDGSVWTRTFEIEEGYAALAEERTWMLLSDAEKSSCEESSVKLFCPPAGLSPPFNRAEWITVWDFQPIGPRVVESGRKAEGWFSALEIKIER